MNWNIWIRQTHRWLSIAFTVAVIINIVVMGQEQYPVWLGAATLIPLTLLLVTGLYMFALPYITRWRNAASARISSQTVDAR